MILFHALAHTRMWQNTSAMSKKLISHFENKQHKHAWIWDMRLTNRYVKQFESKVVEWNGCCTNKQQWYWIDYVKKLVNYTSAGSNSHISHRKWVRSTQRITVDFCWKWLDKRLYFIHLHVAKAKSRAVTREAAQKYDVTNIKIVVIYFKNFFSTLISQGFLYIIRQYLCM